MEQGNTGEPKKNKTVIYVVVGVLVLCCLCCVVVFVGQYLLEHSNFSLVNTLRLIV
jgi:hypothetical protein